MALTKGDIANHIRNQTGMSLKQSKQATESILEIIISTLETGDDVLVSGFGKFSVKKKADRKGRNPATGKDLMLPARRVVTFTCSRKMWDRVNGGDCNEAFLMNPVSTAHVGSIDQEICVRRLHRLHLFVLHQNGHQRTGS